MTYAEAIVLALGAAFFWAFAQVVGKIALEEFTSTTFNAIRITLVAAFLTPIVLATGLQLGGTLPVILALSSGTLGIYAASQIFFYTIKRSQAHITTTVANSSPVFTVIFALLILTEDVTAALPFSLVMVVIGSLMHLPKNAGPVNWRWGVPLAIIVSVLWGFDQMLRKWVLNLNMGGLTFLWIAMVSAALLFQVNALAKNSWRDFKFRRRYVGLAILSGLCGQMIGTFLHISAVGFENVSALAPITTASIPFGFLMSLVMVRERASKRAWAGMVLVFAGVILAVL